MRAERIALLGAGAWGTALAGVLAQPGRRIDLLARDARHVEAMRRHRENRTRLPGVRLAPVIEPAADYAVAGLADVVVVAVPAQTLRSALARLPGLRPGVPLVLCAKGIEADTGLTMGEVATELLPNRPVAALSGPSFAHDVARERPTAVALACADEGMARELAETFARPAFRVYYTTDLEGVEIGGAAKNVLAIACGIAAGLDLGASASAALVARGFAELARFGQMRGARFETLAGLSGLGDLVLTASSSQSRNFSFGHDLGRGATLAEAAGGRLAEGAATAGVLARLAVGTGVDMPIVEAVAAIVGGTLEPAAAMDKLLARPIRAEIDEGK